MNKTIKEVEGYFHVSFKKITSCAEKDPEWRVYEGRFRPIGVYALRGVEFVKPEKVKIDISHMTSLMGLFSNSKLNGLDISDWDVSHVKNMNRMFHKCDTGDIDVSKWDMSNIATMKSLF